jgi:hypothetical protein
VSLLLLLLPVCQAVVKSFLGFGLQGLSPKLGGWEWQELQELNAQRGWQVGGLSGHMRVLCVWCER